MPPKKKTQTQSKAIAKVGNDYPQLFRELNNLEEKDMLFKKVVEEENWYREVFAQERESKELSDPYVMLVDAHSNFDIFKSIKETPEEAALPRVFPVTKELKRQPGEPCIVDAKEFDRNFDVFTEAQLRFLNWDNVFAAGGAVLNALLPLPKEHAENNQARRNYYHNVAYKNSDIDLFIYGLDEEAANKKLDEIYFAVCESITAKAVCFRSKHAVTIVSQYPYRHIQVVLRLYKSPAEILMGFDVDSCSVGYDGKKVYMTPRAHRALTHQYNAVDMTRRSPTYEQRLAKYADRGFSVLVPTLQRNKIDPQLFERRFDQLQGLAKLILLEKLSTPEGRQRYKNQQRLKKLRPPAEQKSSFIDHIGGKLGRQLDNDEYVRERLSDGGGDASDYSTVFLPWSPRWTAEKIRKLMYTKDMILNSKWYDPNKKIHTHPCFFGTAQEVTRDCCGKCPPIPDELVDPDTPFVSGVMTWVTVNPGAQARIGSFHPITEGDWTEGAYVNEDMNRMFSAINDDNTKALDAFLKDAKKQNLDDVVNTRDCLGRTPLMIAAFANSVKCTKTLLKQGARISARTGDGRNALMIAAQYGHLEIVQMIVQRGKDLVTENAAKAEEEKNKKSKKQGKKDKKPKKKKGSDDEDEEEEDDPMDEEEEEENEEEEEVEEDEEKEEEENEDEDFTSIKSMVDQKKKEQQEAAEAADLVLQADKGDDTLDINATEWDLKFSAIQFAIFFGWIDVVKALIAAEAEFNADVPTDHGGFSNLYLALFCSQVEVGKFLLEKGFPITHLDNNQENILHKAARCKDIDFVTMLLEWNTKNNGGLNVNAKNNSNQTPLNIVIPSATSPAKPKSSSDMDVDNNNSDKDTIDEEMFTLIKTLVEKGGAKVQYGAEDLPTQQDQQVHNFNRGFGYNRHQHSGSIPSQIRHLFQQPLHQAVNIKSKKLVQYLLDKGALVNFVNSSWQTVLDIAAYNVDMYSDETRDANYNYTTSIGYVEQYLKTHKKDSFAYNEVDTQRSGISQPSAESVEETIKQRKKELNIWKDLKSILLKFNAKRSESVTIDSADTELADHIKSRRYHHGNYGSYTPYQRSAYTPSYDIKFSNIQERVGTFHSWSREYSSHQDVYLELFNAVWSGDVKKVKSLTIEKEIGKQAHICSHSNFTRRTPLHLAIEKNNPEMVQLVLDIAVQQYTPMKFKAKKTEEKGAPLINNYDLSVMMRDMRPGQYIDPNSLKVVEDNKEIDHSALVQMNCTTSVTSLLLHTDSKQRNSLLSAVGHNSDKAFKVLTDYITANIDKLIVGTSWEDIPSNHPKKGKKPDFLGTLYHSRGPQNYSAFELAIANGNTKVREISTNFPYPQFATVLLEHGGLDAAYSIPTPPTPNEEKGAEDDMYEGLDVGGKKMDWVREVRENKPKRLYQRTCIHLAAAHDQVKSIEFLTAPATANIFKKHTKLETTTDLDLNATDEKHRTPLHWAVANESMETLTYLAKLPKGENQKESMLNTPDHDGNTPLIHAVHKGSLKMVDALLNAGANVNAVDKTRGWTALHHASALNRKEMPDIVKSLLKKSDKNVVNSQSKYFKQSPLVIASYHGNEDVVKLLVESGKADVHLRDAAGDFALHHAVKQAQKSVVDILLPKKDKAFDEENGVGFTALDSAAQSLLARLHGNNSTLVIPYNYSQIYQHVRSVQGESRTLVPSEVVVELTNIILTQTEAEVKEQHERLKAQAGAVKKWNPYRDYDDESDEESHEDDDEGLTTGEIHQASVEFAATCKDVVKPAF